MTTGVKERSEGEFTNRPTELHLFRFNSAQHEKVSILYQDGITLARDLNANEQHFAKERERYESQKANLDSYRDKKSELTWQYASYRTCSAAYLKIYDALSAKNVPHREIADFFLNCLLANSYFQSLYSHRGDNDISSRRYLSDERAGFPEFYARLRRIAGRPPSWFNGSEESWLEFNDNYADFSSLLEADQANPHRRLNEGHLGFTSLEFTPDWLEDIETRLPTKGEIEEELINDTREQDLVQRHEENAYQHTMDVFHYYMEAYLKALIRLEGGRRKLFPKISSLPHVLIYLNATETMTEHPSKDLDELYNERTRPPGINPESSREKSISTFSEFEGLSGELLALWLEKKLRDVMLYPSTILDDELVHKMSLFKPENDQELRTYKDTDKRFFRVFNYELKPLMSLLTQDEQDYLKDLLNDSKGEHLELIIWEIAYILSNRLGKAEGSTAQRARTELKRFIVSWLKNYWKWAYEELTLALTANETQEYRENQQPSEDTEDDFDEIDNIDLLIEKSQKGNLAVWGVYYSANRRVKSGAELIEITGESLQEKEDILERILLEEGQQVSIKNSSVINALDWISSVPPEALYMMPKIEVSGEEFTKVKRGSVRILFQIDRNQKELTFFLHQKKAMAYRF